MIIFYIILAFAGTVIGSILARLMIEAIESIRSKIIEKQLHKINYIKRGDPIYDRDGNVLGFAKEDIKDESTGTIRLRDNYDNLPPAPPQVITDSTKSCGRNR